jgi:uncharacterized protein
MTAELSPVLVIVVTGIIGLLMIPFGLPGLWVILLGIIGVGYLTDFQTMGIWFLGIMIALAIIGEVFEAWIGFGYAKKYGGSSRAGWGARVGGLVGAIIGVPVPIIGSVIAGFIGAFIGAALFEYTKARQAHGSVRAGWGAVLGRAFASAAKMAIGLVMAVWALLIALGG